MNRDTEDTQDNEMLKDEILYRKRMNQRRYERLAAKSFILRKKQEEENPYYRRKNRLPPKKNLSFDEDDQSAVDNKREIELEQNLDHFLEKVHEKKRHQKEVEISPWFSQTRLGDYIVKNIDLFTTTFIEANALVLTYPAQTLKVRIQSRHAKQDVCHFRKNKVDKAPMHRGVSNAFAQLLICNSIHFSVSRYAQFQMLKRYENQSYYTRKLFSYLAADIISAPFRLYFEIRKMLRQMNVDKISFTKQVQSWKLTILPFLVRDIIFRITMESFYHYSIFSAYKSKIKNQAKIGIKQSNTIQQQINWEASRPQHTKLGLFMASTLAACVVTMPLDVVCTRLVTQQTDKYRGVIDCFKRIVKEEGYPKFISGLGARSGYFFIHGSILLAMTPRLKPMLLEAYSYDVNDSI